MAVCDYARHVVGMDGANSTEFDPDAVPGDRLPAGAEGGPRHGRHDAAGSDPVKLHDGTRAREVYGEAVIYERHRHRYEVNNHLRKRLEHAGLVCSGTSPDRPPKEIAERRRPLFVASQFHPEFKSRPLRPQPLFREFVAAAPERVRQGEPRSQPAPSSAALAGGARAVFTKFARFCEIESPSGNERAMADAVIAELRALRLEEVEEDDRGRRDGLECGQRVRSGSRPEAPWTILLCAHMDTVPLAAPVEVVREEGIFRNRNEGILGADNKAAVAMILTVVRHLVHTRTPVGVELLFTSEEPGPRGQGLRRRAASRRVRLRLRPRFRPSVSS